MRNAPVGFVCVCVCVRLRKLCSVGFLLSVELLFVARLRITQCVIHCDYMGQRAGLTNDNDS